MKTVISGGTGLLGSTLGRDLAKDGHEVVALSRSPEKARNLPDGVRAVGWDGRTVGEWAGELEGATAVVNLAGYRLAAANPLTMRWTKVRRQRIIQSREDAGRVLAEAVRQAASKPKVFVQCSAVGFYGVLGDEEVDETAPPGNDFLARVCQRWEASSKPVEEAGVRRVVVRIGVVLANGNAAFDLQKLPIALFVGGPIGSGRQVLPWIHIDDVVGAIRFLIDSPAQQGAFNLTAPAPVASREFGRMLARLMRRPYWFPVPAFMLKLALGEVSTVVLDGQRAVPARLQAAGYPFRFAALESALLDLLGL
ncbi:MAG: TIGR01777 family protein [Chloroflexi bacterium]|nr:TIGR01777 family protein [Chloroflexota bacterium]